MTFDKTCPKCGKKFTIGNFCAWDGTELQEAITLTLLKVNNKTSKTGFSINMSSNVQLAKWFHDTFNSFKFEIDSMEVSGTKGFLITGHKLELPKVDTFVPKAPSVAVETDTTKSLDETAKISADRNREALRNL